MTARRTHPRRAAFALAAAAALTLVGISAAPAAAHNYPVGSNPADGAVVTEQPGTVSLTTNDSLLDLGDGAAMTVSGPANDPRYYGDGCVRIIDRSIELDAQLGAAGDYVVEWQVVSADGHPISGSFVFDWQPSASVELAEGVISPPVCRESGDDVTDPGESSRPPSGPGQSAGEGAGIASSDIVWIAGGAVLALAAAGIAWWTVTRRRDDDAGE